MEYFAVFKNKLKKTWIVTQDIVLNIMKKEKYKIINTDGNLILKYQLDRKD